MLPLEGDEVDEDLGTCAERPPQSVVVGTIDLDVLDARRQLALSPAADDDFPPALPKPRDQRAAGLAAAAEKKCPPRHRRDDSSLIF
jgi:hypothetical protein